MGPIPKNNLAERMRKLGYDPNIVKIVPPILDNSQIIKKDDPKPSYSAYKVNLNTEPEFKPLATVNIDEWSDFEEEE